MELHAALTAVEKSKEFKTFKKAAPSYKLAHAFSMHAPKGEFSWQFGYYSLETKKLVVFKSEPIEKMPEDDAFNEGSEIKALTLTKVTVTAQEAQETALTLLGEKYPADVPNKVILILQRLDRQIYNFTFITVALNMINIRVDAATKEIVSSEHRSLMSLRRQE